MKRVGGALIAVLILSVSVLITRMCLTAARADLVRISFTPLGLSVIAACAVVGIIGVLAWWFVPMGRRPHSVPMWNDIHHRKGARAFRAFSQAGLYGALMAGIGWVAITALLPGMNSHATRVIHGGVVIDISSGNWRCPGKLTLRDGVERRYICACPRGDCLKGYGDDISPGKRVDLEVGENWAGTVIVGLVVHDS
jgi:hypothetical protein